MIPPATLTERRYSSERHLWRFPGGHVLHFKALTPHEVKHAGDEILWEHFDLRVVAHHAVVVKLPGERDLVLGRGQFFLQAHEVLVRLEFWISLGNGEQ